MQRRRLATLYFSTDVQAHIAFLPDCVHYKQIQYCSDIEDGLVS